MKLYKLAIAVIVATLTLALASASASAQTIYDSTATPLPGNLPSVGAEAYAFAQVGDSITFAGTARSPQSATVTMSSWACQSGNWFTATCATTPGATFSVPITLNVYNAGAPTPGSLILSKTQTFNIPYRPSSSGSCTGGRWYDAGSNTCFNGLASNITFDLSSFNVVLPNNVVFGVSYNTSHYGPSPIGESPACYSTAAGCPYDSLNVALSSSVVTGSKPFPKTLYWDTIYGPNYCDGGTNGTGFFRLDSPGNACWFNNLPPFEDYIPAAKFTAYTIATSAGQCKNDGWKTLARAGGSTFKNQGDCIQYVNTGK